jgi:hypothetical protein
MRPVAHYVRSFKGAHRIPVASPHTYTHRPRGRGVWIACAALAAACVAHTPVARADVMIQYELSSDASMTIGGNKEAVAGTFTYDVTTGVPTAADFSISGSLNASGFDDVACITDFESEQAVCALDSNGYESLLLVFSASLADDQSDPLSASVYIGGYNTSYTDPSGNPHFATAVTGAADPVPEPSSLALIVSGLMIFGLISRVGRRGHRPQPDNPDLIPSH